MTAYELAAEAAGSRRAAENKTSETIMPMHRSLATGLWLLAAAGAYAMVVSWADDAQTGKVHPWVLIVVFWAAAAVSVAIHHLSHYLADRLADAPGLLGRSRVRLARGWGTLGRLRPYLRGARDAVSALASHLAHGVDAVGRSRLGHGHDLVLARSFGQAPEELEAGAPGQMVEIGR